MENLNREELEAAMQALNYLIENGPMSVSVNAQHSALKKIGRLLTSETDNLSNYEKRERQLDPPAKPGRTINVIRMQVQKLIKDFHLGADVELQTALYQLASYEGAPGHFTMYTVLKEFVEWCESGALTSSDREMFIRRFKSAVAEAEGENHAQ